MFEPKLEVPAELRDMAEKSIDQAEKAFGMFFDAANKSVASVPSPGTEISKQALTFTEQNMKAAFEHARSLLHATDLQEAARRVPDELIMVETDSPYLAPQPVRGKPNEPANVARTAEFVAELRGVSYEQLEATVEANAARTFGW